MSKFTRSTGMKLLRKVLLGLALCAGATVVVMSDAPKAQAMVRPNSPIYVGHMITVYLNNGNSYTGQCVGQYSDSLVVSPAGGGEAFFAWGQIESVDIDD